MSEGLRVVFIGPPGSGKGTQADFLKKDAAKRNEKICHLATGDMLRAAVKAGTPIGKQAKEIMDRGELVPDSIMIGLIKDALKAEECRNGFILDGFPRTLDQAKALDNMLDTNKQKLDHVFEFNIDDNLLLRRITGRLVHLPSGRTYHREFNPPKVPGKDDVTGEPLIQRDDDNEATLKKRLVAYHQYTAPLIAYYRQRGILTTLDAASKPNAVYAQIMAAFAARKRK